MTKLLNSSIALVFGGEDGLGNIFNDMYSLHLERAEWRKVNYSPGPRPEPRLLHTATAISSTAIVVLFGDVAITPAPDKETTAASNDAWVFDLKDRTWREIKDSGPQRPPPLSCHSAVLGSGPGLSRAIYVYGGLGNGILGSAVYRLRLADWRWQFLPFFVRNEHGKDVLIDRLPAVDEEYHPQPGGPSRRESHGAVWVSDMNGMVVVGGDGGVELFDDCWLFSPSHTQDVWRWDLLPMTIARGLPRNRLPKSAGHSLLTYPSGGRQLLMWGGLRWPETENRNAANNCYIIDLDAMQTSSVRLKGTIPKAGRLLHGIVRLNKKLVTYGGCYDDGVALSETEEGQLVKPGKAEGQAAMDFGPEASNLAAQGSESIREVTRAPKEDLDIEEDNEAYLPLVGPSSIPPGTPLSGRIIDAADFGYFVSVVINGKLYKGVLVANPLNGEQGLSAAKTHVEIDSPKEPEPKRKRIDPVADALPDPDEEPEEPKRKHAEEVIALD